MTFYEIILKAHSGIRWLVVAVAVLAIVKLLMTWLGKGNFGKADSILTKSFIGMMDLQMVLGISMIIWFVVNEMPVGMHRWEHAGTMLVALIVAHLSAKWKRAPGPVRARNTLIVFVISLILVAAGISRLPQGWTMS